MIAGRRFQFRPGLTLCVALGLAVLVGLGVWQLQRLQWKRALIAEVETRMADAPIPFAEAVARAEAGEKMDYAPVTLAGTWRVGGGARVFGTYDGAPGVYVFDPLNAAAVGAVYVNLGFLPQGMDAAAETGAAEIVGLFRSAEHLSPPASWFRSAAPTPDGLWFVRDPRLFADGFTTPPYYIDSFARDGARWPKGGTTRVEFRNQHLQYAFTWFGLAAGLLGVWLIFSLPKSEVSNNFKK